MQHPNRASAYTSFVPEGLEDTDVYAMRLKTPEELAAKAEEPFYPITRESYVPKGLEETDIIAMKLVAPAPEGIHFSLSPEGSSKCEPCVPLSFVLDPDRIGWEPYVPEGSENEWKTLVVPRVGDNSDSDSGSEAYIESEDEDDSVYEPVQITAPIRNA